MNTAKTLVIEQKFCKGCGICVEFCPNQVLALERGKVVSAQPDMCIYCGMCEKLCPDYAIYTEERGDENNE